jgi:branched-chain amino acid transport system ATP-binding protein
MTVRENLDMGAYTRSDKDDVATDRDRLFERLPNLHRRQHQRAGDLSGGQQ